MTDEAASDWRAWRRNRRRQLLAQRSALSSATRVDLSRRVLANLDRVLDELPVRVLGIYWPIKREINLLEWAADQRARRGIVLALPVVAQPKAPLEYRHWYPSARMTRGFWSIPVPVEGAVATPDVVIAPLVGFRGFWRLGYGGGYFDRTLAARAPRPAAIGIGFDMMETPDFGPEPHDVPMSAVVTEGRILQDHD